MEMFHFHSHEIVCLFLPSLLHIKQARARERKRDLPFCFTFLIRFSFKNSCSFSSRAQMRWTFDYKIPHFIFWRCKNCLENQKDTSYINKKKKNKRKTGHTYYTKKIYIHIKKNCDFRTFLFEKKKKTRNEIKQQQTK